MKQKIFFRLFMALFMFSLTILLMEQALSAREITDDCGRKVKIPDTIKKVYTTGPPSTYMVYALDPDLVAGLNMMIPGNQKPYLKKSFTSLPVMGGFFGQGNAANLEMVMKSSPDLIINWAWKGAPFNEKAFKALQNLNIPIVKSTMYHLNTISEDFLFYGRVLGREKRAGELAAYSDRVLKEISELVSSLPEEKRPTVYYAEGKDGLSTECDSSIHTELIAMAGGRNINHCTAKTVYGMERISIEEVLIKDPQVILVQDPSFFSRIFKDPKWRGISAVKTKRVYLVPREPFNWFDRPPSFMRLLGLQWVAKCFYPAVYSRDMVKETAYFCRLFFGIDLPDNEIKRIMNTGK